MVGRTRSVGRAPSARTIGEASGMRYVQTPLIGEASE